MRLGCCRFQAGEQCFYCTPGHSMAFLYRGHCVEALRNVVPDRDMEAGVSCHHRALGHIGVQSRMRSGTQNL